MDMIQMWGESAGCLEIWVKIQISIYSTMYAYLWQMRKFSPPIAWGKLKRLFSRVHATLEAALSVCRLVHWSVRPSVRTSVRTSRLAFFAAPANPHATKVAVYPTLLLQLLACPWKVFHPTSDLRSFIWSFISSFSYLTRTQFNSIQTFLLPRCLLHKGVSLQSASWSLMTAPFQI